MPSSYSGIIDGGMCCMQIAANLPGLLMSGLAIWTTSIYQIWAGSKQKEYQVGLLHALLSPGILAPCA